MSYQFEDDSALEELLNQQLERKRQPQLEGKRKVSIRDNVGQLNKPSLITKTDTSITNKDDDLNRSINEQKDSAQFLVNTNNQPSSKGKLATWLSSSNRGQSSEVSSLINSTKITDEYYNDNVLEDVVDTNAQSSARTYDNNSTKREYYLDQSISPTFLTFKESELKDMSKQKLIQLFLTEIDPAIKSLQSKVENQDRLETEIEELNKKLEIKSNELESIEKRHMETFKLTESSWQQLNKQLNSRLEAREEEFKELLNKQKDLIQQLDDEQKKHINELKETYKQRLLDEKKQFEDILNRRDQFHKLELESKLKVNCDINQMELIFSEWTKMIKSTVLEFENHYKEIESLLDKQTIQINSNNFEISKKSKYLQEQYRLFDEQLKVLTKLADNIDNNWPKLNELYENNEGLVKKINDKLSEFIQLNEELKAQERKLSKLNGELREEKEKFLQEKFQLGLDSNRLIYKEERLSQLEILNKENSRRLEEQLKQLEDKDNQLKLLISTLDSKNKKLKEQNYELHSERKKIIEKEDELRKLELDLNNERNSLDKEKSKLQMNSNKLINFRNKAQKELQQLKRLQKALVCSICLDRLFKSKLANTTMTITDDDKKFTYNDGLVPKKEVNFSLELANLKHYIDIDGKDLEAENKFIELLSYAK